MSEINVVPYIDVMLVLLIIFMVTAPLLVRNVDVDLPVTQGSESSVAEELPPILVGVDDENRYFIFNDETGERDYENNEAGAIAEAVAASLAEPGREAMVYGAASVEYQHVLRLLQVLTRLRDAGNSIVVIEHNLDVIKCADYIIDLGPEGGDEGGSIVASVIPWLISSTWASVSR